MSLMAFNTIKMQYTKFLSPDSHMYPTNRHLKFNIPQNEFLIFPQTCLFHSLPISKWQLFFFYLHRPEPWSHSWLLFFLLPVQANSESFGLPHQPRISQLLTSLSQPNRPRHHHPSPGLLQKPPHCFYPVLLESIFCIADKRVLIKLAKACHLFAQNPLKSIPPHPE